MSKKVVITKKGLEDLLSELGPCLHTALRKHCDSNPTSIAWNLIYVSVDGGWWTKWLEHLSKALRKDRLKITTLRDFTQIISKASISEDLNICFDWYDFSGNERYVAIAMKCALQLFDRDDWFCFTQMAYETAGGKLVN